MIKFLKKVLLWVIVPSVMLLVSILLGAPKLVTESLLLFALSTSFTFLLLNVYSIPLKKNKYRSNITFYQWMDELDDFDGYLLEFFKTCNIRYRTVDNLNQIKKILMNLTKCDKSTLKIYRAFYNEQLKETAEAKYYKIISVSLIPICLFIFGDNLGLINIYVTFFVLIFIIITLACISVKLSNNKKRISILIAIIDLCIEEVEEKEMEIG